MYYTPESANFLETGSGTPTSTPQPLNFSGDGPYTTTLRIEVHDDMQSDPAGNIRVTLNEEPTPPASNYTVAGTPDNTAIVAVTDDDSLPLLTITAPTTGTAESARMVDFVIGASVDLGDRFPGSL